MTALALALVIPWAAGIVLALLDGRRRLVGWLAVAALAANLAALVVLAAQVLPEGAVEATTGDWPAGVGITLRADALGVLFAVLSSLALLAATVHEVLDGRARARLPRARRAAGRRADRRVPHRRRLQLLRLLRAVDDGRVHPRDLRRHAPRAGRGARLHRPSTCSARSSSCSRSPASTTSPARWTWRGSRSAWRTSTPTPRS